MQDPQLAQELAQTDLFGIRAQKPAHIVVVGAGPCGAALAYLLARGGVNVTLIEATDLSSTLFDDVLLGPAAEALLARIGFNQDSSGLARTQLRQCDFHQSPHIIRRMLGRKNLHCVQRNGLAKSLIEKASAFDGFTFMQRVEVADIAAQNGRAVGVQIKLGEQFDILRADHVIVAEGRFGALKQAYFQNLGLTDNSQNLIDPICVTQHIVGPKPENHAPHNLDIFAMPKGYGIARVDDTRLSLTLVSFQPPKSQLNQLEIEDWFAEKLMYFPRDLALWVTQHRREFYSPISSAYRPGSAARWHAPGIVFLGDGAHPSLPLTSFGLEAALYDAFMAAQMLGPHMIDVPSPTHIDPVVQQLCASRLKRLRRRIAQQSAFITSRLNHKSTQSRTSFFPPIWRAKTHMSILFSRQGNLKAKAELQTALFGETLD